MVESCRSLILINQYFVSSFSQRKQEIDDTVKRNSTHPAFEKYIIFLEKEEDRAVLEQVIIADKHIEVINVGKRTNYADIFKFLSDRKDLFDKVCIYSNADIYFDDTIEELKKVTERHFICLSRREIDANGNSVDYPPKVTMTTQDLWAFVNPVPAKLIDATNFVNGHWGCENRLAYEAQAVGYQLFNPYLTVKIYHNHKSQQGRPPASIRIPGNYTAVFQCTNLSTPSQIHNFICLGGENYLGHPW